MSQRRKAAAFILLTAVCASTSAQDNTSKPYQPLFTDAMIASAAPEQRERMRAAEANNRRNYERRKSDAEQGAARASAQPGAPPPRQVRSRRKKIYKWVDDKGRVHFGDAPAGEGAEEVKIRGANAPSSVPSSGNVSAPSPQSEPSRSSGGNNSRSTRRGS